MSPTLKVGLGIVGALALFGFALMLGIIPPIKNERPPIRESCFDVASRFGPGSDMSEAQKEELWKEYAGRSFDWDLKVTNVASSITGGYVVQGTCRPRSASLLFDVTIHYRAAYKNFALALQKGRAYEFAGDLRQSGTLTGITAEGTPLSAESSPVPAVNP